MDSTQHFVRRYPSRCTTFNMIQASRVKKGEEMDAQRGDASVLNKSKEKKSEVWINEDDDNFFIVRLLYPPNEHP